MLEHSAAVGSVFLAGRAGSARAHRREGAGVLDRFTSGRRDADSHAAVRLVERDYLLRLPDSAFTDEEEYIFKHNREREKIAELTTTGALRRYHQPSPISLSQKDAVRSQEEYLRCWHGISSTLFAEPRAAVTYVEAGNVAREHFAAKKAHEYYQKGLSLLGSDDARCRIDALHNLGDVLLLLRANRRSIGRISREC